MPKRGFLVVEDLPQAWEENNLLIEEKRKFLQNFLEGLI